MPQILTDDSLQVNHELLDVINKSIFIHSLYYALDHDLFPSVLPVGYPTMKDKRRGNEISIKSSWIKKTVIHFYRSENVIKVIVLCVMNN